MRREDGPAWKGAGAVSERLTKRKDHGCACWNGDQNLVTLKRYSKMIEALAQYEDVIFDADGNEVISLARLRELAETERENRLTVHKYGNCNRCPTMRGKTILDEPCKSCYDRALAATEPKGDAT